MERQLLPQAANSARSRTEKRRNCRESRGTPLALEKRAFWMVSQMTVAALQLRKGRTARVPAPRRTGGLVQLLPPAPGAEPALLDWARAVAVAADRRVAQLEARLAHLETQISSDELTGLLNRRGFLDAFARSNDAARRGGPGGIVVMCDLDGFKNVNDLLGHAEGDGLLRRLGALLRRETRKMDASARLSGDEFALLLIGTSAAAARRKCQSLARIIGSTGLSASFGFAAFAGDESEEKVLHRADMAMYEEKRRKAAARRAPGGEPGLLPSP